MINSSPRFSEEVEEDEMDMEDCGHGMEVPGQDSGTTACVCLISKNKVKICNRLSIFSKIYCSTDAGSFVCSRSLSVFSSCSLSAVSVCASLLLGLFLSEISYFSLSKLHLAGRWQRGRLPGGAVESRQGRRSLLRSQTGGQGRAGQDSEGRWPGDRGWKVRY